MINFTCTYCEKTINGVTKIVDKTYFAHQECEVELIEKLKLDLEADAILKEK